MACCNPDDPLRYAAGEIPEPISYAFLDYNGDPIPLTGFTATAQLVHPDGTETSYDTNVAVATPLEGLVTFDWPSSLLTETGVYRLVLWAASATPQRYASDEILIYIDDRGAIPTP